MNNNLLYQKLFVRSWGEDNSMDLSVAMKTGIGLIFVTDL